MASNKLEHSCSYYTKILGDFLDSIGYQVSPYDENFKVLLDSTGRPVKLNGELFVCPLCCQRIYLSGNLRRNEKDYLSFDHLPPESVGSMYKVPVCSTCNSKFGRGIDLEILKEVSFQRFASLEHNSKVQASVEIRDGQSRAKIELEFRGNGNEKTLLLKIPKTKGTLKNLIASQIKRDGALNVLFQGSSWQRAYLGVLKAAYLMMFRSYGYSFVFSENAAKLRRIIAEDTRHPLDNIGLLGINESTPFVGLSLVTVPEEIKCYICTMPMTDKNSGITRFYTTAIPMSGEKGWKSYLNLEKYVDKKVRISAIPLTKTPLELGILQGYSRYDKAKTEGKVFIVDLEH